MKTFALRLVVRGTLASAAAACSLAVFAQAPVSDVNVSSDIEQRLAVLERMVQSRTQTQHRLQEQLDTMQYEVDSLRGAVEEHTNQLEKVLERQRELYLEIDKRVEALKSAGAVAAQPSAQTPSTSSIPQDSGVRNSEDVATAYENAVNLILKSREYDKAIPAFQDFLSRFPDSEYAPNAHYWLGQLLFNKQQWTEAKEQFSIVNERFVDSAKRPDALLKLGVIAERQGNDALAKQLFNQVVNDFPSSSARKLAEAKLNN